MRAKSKQEIEQERRELRRKSELQIAKLKRHGWEAYEGHVGLTETKEQAWKDSIKSHEWVVRTMDSLKV